MLLFAFATALAWAQTVSDADAGLIRLARAAVEAEVLRSTLPRPGQNTKVQPVFVTIERNGKILGCRGDLTPRTASLEEEVIQVARSAAAHDPRYRPMVPADLKGFLVTVTVVSRLEPLDGVDGLMPGDGLVLKAGNRTGIVLPWEGKDPKVRLAWAYRKAGVAEGSPGTLYRLIATRCRG